jgi:hypothetical protein
MKRFTLLFVLSFIFWINKAQHLTGLTAKFDGSITDTAWTLQYPTFSTLNHDRDTIKFQDGKMLLKVKSDTVILTLKLDSFNFSSNPFVSIHLTPDSTVFITSLIEDVHGAVFQSNSLQNIKNKEHNDIVLKLSYFSYFDGDRIVRLDSVNIRSISFGFVLNKQSYLTTTYVIDSIKLGDLVILPTATQSSFVDNFDDNSLSTLWQSEMNYTKNDTAYKFKEENGTLKIKADKEAWNGFRVNTGLIDMSKNPCLSVKVKTDTAITLQIWLWDFKSAYDPGMVSFYIPASDHFKTYYFNYTGKFVLADIDSSRIESVLLNFSSPNKYHGNVVFDDFRMGDSAYVFFNHAPTIDPMDTVRVAVGTEAVSYNLTGISDGDDGSQALSIRATAQIKDIASSTKIAFNQDSTGAVLSFIPNSVGVTTITVRIKDDGASYTNSGMDTKDLVIPIKVENLSSTQNIEQISAFKLFPNPAGNSIYINLPELSEPVSVSIYNLLGKEVLTTEINGQQIHKIDLSMLEQGIYIIKAANKSYNFTSRFIKQ